MKQKDDYLNWDDYKRMEFTQNVRLFPSFGFGAYLH